MIRRVPTEGHRACQMMTNDIIKVEKDAKQKIQKEDKWRADNYRYYTGRIWGASSNFDLTVNTALGEEYIEMCIREAMKR